MPTTFRPCAPDQSLLFPHSPRDWLPEGHLAFFIADTVAALDLKAFYAPYEGDGRRNQPFDPQMMETVLPAPGRANICVGCMQRRPPRPQPPARHPNSETLMLWLRPHT